MADVGINDLRSSRIQSGQNVLGSGDFVYRSGTVVPRFVRGEGSSLWDHDGKEYIDLEGANGSLAFGYDSGILEDAFSRVRALPTLPSFLESDLRIELATKIVELFERELGVSGRVAFDIGGAQGIELALKIAHSHNRRRALAVFEGAYHGRSIFTSLLSGSRRYREPGDFCLAEIVRLPYPRSSRWVCEGTGWSGESAVRFVEDGLSQDAFGLASARDFPVAAFLFEPVLNVSGMIEPDQTYLTGVIESFRRRGAIIVADEIFTGFYRTGPFLGVQRYGIKPDLVVLSKALSNGMAPISCVWARDDLLTRQAFPPGSHSVTFGNTPLSLALATTVLDRFESWHSRTNDLANLTTSLAKFCADIMTDVSVDHAKVIGAIARIELAGPNAARVRAAAATLADRGKGPNVLVASTGASETTINLHPPLTISSRDLERGLTALRQAFESLTT